jgi:hypothetical protein
MAKAPSGVWGEKYDIKQFTVLKTNDHEIAISINLHTKREWLFMAYSI